LFDLQRDHSELSRRYSALQHDLGRVQRDKEALTASLRQLEEDHENALSHWQEDRETWEAAWLQSLTQRGRSWMASRQRFRTCRIFGAWRWAARSRKTEREAEEAEDLQRERVTSMEVEAREGRRQLEALFARRRERRALGMTLRTWAENTRQAHETSVAAEALARDLERRRDFSLVRRCLLGWRVLSQGTKAWTKRAVEHMRTTELERALKEVLRQWGAVARTAKQERRSEFHDDDEATATRKVPIVSRSLPSTAEELLKYRSFTGWRETVHIAAAVRAQRQEDENNKASVTAAAAAAAASAAAVPSMVDIGFGLSTSSDHRRGLLNDTYGQIEDDVVGPLSLGDGDYLGGLLSSAGDRRYEYFRPHHRVPRESDRGSWEYTFQKVEELLGRSDGVLR